MRQNAYASINSKPKEDVKATYCVDLWLSDLTTPIGKGGRRNAMTCYGLATLAQTLFVPGFKDSILVLMMFLELYGNTKPTRLIRRIDVSAAASPDSQCNNRLYSGSGHNPNMLCPNNKNKRSRFMDYTCSSRGTNFNDPHVRPRPFMNGLAIYKSLKNLLSAFLGYDPVTKYLICEIVDDSVVDDIDGSGVVSGNEVVDR